MNAHNQILNRFGAMNGFSNRAVNSMRAGSAYADSVLVGGRWMGYQHADYSYMHAMTSESNPNAAETCKKANVFVENKMSEYRNWLGISNSASDGRTRNYATSSAYHALGMAMHTVMDSTSPAHEGFQYWDNSQIPRHGPGFGGLRGQTEENWEAMKNDPERLARTLDLMNKVLNGDTLFDCECG